MTPDPLPEFDKPPVIEVVCGIMFKPLQAILAPYLGLLWDKFKTDYPRCQEVAPLAPIIEQFGEGASVQIEFSETPPLPRVWFVRGDETGIVQVQRDRFLHNWKKVQPGDEYPRYKTVIELFRERLDAFEAFLKEHSLGSLEPRQYELTYVNHIPKGEGFTGLREIGRILPDYDWRAGLRFLPEPESVNWRTAFALPDRTGRVHATIRSASRLTDSLPLLLLELTARGMPKDTTRDAMWSWFETAHEWIVRGFADLTGENVHKSVWKRTR